MIRRREFNNIGDRRKIFYVAICDDGGSKYQHIFGNTYRRYSMPQLRRDAGKRYGTSLIAFLGSQPPLIVHPGFPSLPPPLSAPTKRGLVSLPFCFLSLTAQLFFSRGFPFVDPEESQGRT